MVSLNLTQSECKMLKDILESTLSDLRMQIADTDRLNVREILKEQKRVLNKTVEELEVHASS